MAAFSQALPWNVVSFQRGGRWAHLMRPLLRCLARPMNDEWKMRPYLGVLPLVLSALRQQGGEKGSRAVCVCVCVWAWG